MAIDTDINQAKKVLKEIKEDYDNIKRVIDYLKAKNISARITIHSQSVSAQTAAEEMDCGPEEIIKTLVFVADGNPLLVLVQGSRRVDEDRLRQVLQADDLRLAQPEEVVEHTGYRVGSVSPFDLDLPAIADATLLEQEEVRPAAGSTCVGAILRPQDLLAQLSVEIERIGCGD